MASQDNQAAASSSKAQEAGSPMETTPSLPQQSAPTAALDEATKKDRALAEFMLMLDDYEPLVCFHTLPSRTTVANCSRAKISNEVTDYYLQRVGFETDDVRL